jgi:LysM repeat protein
MAARVSEEDEQQRTVVEMAQQAYLPKKVNYYVKGSEYSLEALAQSFGVNQKDLCRWNQMRLNDVLTPGACLVFYKRGFELEPVHLARSLQPDSIPDSPGIQLANAPSSGSMQDVPTTFKYSYAAGRPASASSYIYTAHRGDTLEKVARRAGIDIGTLCALNGLQPRSGVKPGQKIRLVGATPASGHAGGSRLSTAKAVNIVSSADSKTARGYAPAVYTAERHDTLSKIAKQRGIDLNALCQINGLKKNSALQPGQKIKLFDPGATEKSSCSVGAMNASPHSKQTQSAPNTLQANLKPVRDSKAKGDSTHQQKAAGVQKASTKASNAATSALPAKTDKNSNSKSKK